MTEKADGWAFERVHWGRVLLLLGVILLPRTTPAQAPDIPLLVAGPPALVAAAAPAPISLTASDGAGLELVSLQASAVIEDPLAFTELRLVFRNPESRVREGRFRITLPSGATVSRFAMRIGDHWQEGEVVEQQAARVAYEDFLHRRQDPALLETEAGNEFSARVFPLPANASKELIVSYSQELTRRDEPYRLPLRGLPKLGALAIRALVGRSSSAAVQPASSLGGQRAQHELVEVDKRDFMPDRDFEVTHAGAAGRLGLRHENLVAARIVPIAESAVRDAVPSLFVLVDSSASRAPGFGEQLSALESLLAELRKSADFRVTIAAFDQEVTPVFRGQASQIGANVRKALLARRALGASDLQGALAWLATALKGERHARVLLVSDGVATAGDIAADKLRSCVHALGALGVERIDALAVGGIRDDVLLSRLVTAGLARDGVVLDATRPSSILGQRLTRATRSNVKLDVDGAGWVWPAVLNGVQPGDELVVYADLPADEPFRVKVAGKPLELTGALAAAERPLLERAWVRARIARLSEQRDAVAGSDRDLAEALKKQVIELSTRHRVLSPFTSLLVLESEQDYARFGIERHALADILTVGPGGITLLQRTEIAAPPPQLAQARERDDQARARKSAIAAPARPFAPADASEAELGATLSAPTALHSHAAAEPAVAPREPSAQGFGGAGAGSAGGDFNDGLAYAPGGIRASARARESSPVLAPLASQPAPATFAADEAREASRRRGAANLRTDEQDARHEAKRSTVAPLTGELALVLESLRSGKKQAALARALAWRDRDAGDVLALVALGEAWEALGDASAAARAYGSILDLYPGRADMRRFAGERLERLRGAAALALAVDSYRKAVEQRPDHPASHRLLGFALLKQGRPREAFEALLAGVQRSYPSGRFRGVERILREDLGLIAAVWIKREPALADPIRARLSAAGGNLENGPSLRFVLNWETDANDVDFHIHDGRGGHAFYSAPELKSGGALYADVTTGYGPECFTIRAPAAARAFPYTLQAHYYSRGPMGYGMGKLQVIDHDGHGSLRFEERPFVVMQDGAYVELGAVRGAAEVAR